MDTIVSVFAERARTAPDRPAVGTLTYAELDGRTDRLARRLAAAGARPGDVVGVLCGRSPHTAVLLLAVLKAGAAYLALDPRQPPARQRAMLADAGARVLLADRVPGPGPGDFPAYRVVGAPGGPAPSGSAEARGGGAEAAAAPVVLAVEEASGGLGGADPAGAGAAGAGAARGLRACPEGGGSLPGQFVVAGWLIWELTPLQDWI
ncbi:AMP-binding protein, partial [Streptomyces fradiae]|uniref:AMP-binding protein n=1 Tax=Streptomyces fradiae TaxID=1906 RepID=UPI00344AF9E4